MDKVNFCTNLNKLKNKSIRILSRFFETSLYLNFICRINQNKIRGDVRHFCTFVEFRRSNLWQLLLCNNDRGGERMKCFSVKSSVQSQVVCVRSSVSAGGRSENLGVHADLIKKKKMLNFVRDYALAKTLERPLSLMFYRLI